MNASKCINNLAHSPQPHSRLGKDLGTLNYHLKLKMVSDKLDRVPISRLTTEKKIIKIKHRFQNGGRHHVEYHIPPGDNLELSPQKMHIGTYSTRIHHENINYSNICSTYYVAST